jgi:hypothetical protein
MRPFYLTAILIGLLDPFALAAQPRPFGIERRIPLTTSRVIGSPNPPLPFRVRRTFSRLAIPCPIAVAHDPAPTDC